MSRRRTCARPASGRSISSGALLRWSPASAPDFCGTAQDPTRPFSPARESPRSRWRCSARSPSSALAREFLAFFSLVEQQLRETEVAAHALLLPLQAFDDGAQPFGVRPEHRPAAVDRPAVAIDPHDIDVRRALGHAFLEDFGALVDHRVERPLDDLLVGDVAPLDALFFREILDDLLDHRRRRRPALVIVIVKARAFLLP